jgi:hypothetical protein
MAKEKDNSIHASIHKNDTTGIEKKIEKKIEKEVDNAIMASIHSSDIGIGWIKKILKDKAKK